VATIDALLADGSTVHIRQIEPEDADRVVSMHGRFSDRTRYLRYFAPYPRIPPRDLARFVNVDHHNREALVVAVASGDLVAVGRYERLGPSSPDAEVAFVVEDAFQGKGIGPLLLEHLAQAARAAGLSRFVAEVLPMNRPMIKVLTDAGYHVTREFDEGIVHLTFPIEPTAASETRSRDREQHPEAASVARLLRPASVVIYGVRRDGTGAGAHLLRHVVAGGYTGAVSVVHPAMSTVDDAAAYPSATQAPGADLALVCVPATAVPAAVADAGAAGSHAVVVLSGGFAEIRASGIAAQRDLVALARGHGMRLVGPTCLGLMNTDPTVSLNATMAPRLAPRGRVGVFCQSASTGIALLSEVDVRRLGLSTFVSAGNRADVSGNDLLQYWREDPHTDVVLLYLETFGNPHKFARIARELGRDKPIVAVAAGAAAGPGSGSDRVRLYGGRAPADEAIAALFAHSGVIRVETISQLLDVGQILATCPLPAGSRTAVVGNSAALVQLTDAACVRAGLEVTHTRGAMPPLPPRALRGLVELALGREDVDVVLVAVSPPLPGATLDDALAAIADAATHPDKPVVVVAVGSPSGVPASLPRFRTVEEAVSAVEHVVAYAAWRRTPVGSMVQLSGVDSAAGRDVAARSGPVEELLGAYGVPIAGAQPGVECLVDVVDDPSFGPVVGFGVGGIATQLLGDRAWRVAPLTDVDAHALVRSPRAAALLQGYQGAPAVHLSALEDLVARVGQLAYENPAVKRLILNPVLAHPAGVSVVHASVEYGEPEPRPDTGPRRLL
jgi:acyl-CoA synthetase (NDP forming)/GNAT superfamily N-acetyltransferase